MENIKDRIFVQKGLKRYFLFYIAALILFLIVLSSAILFNKYAASLNITLSKLYTIKINLVKVRDTIKDIHNSLYDIGKIIPQGMLGTSSTKYIYIGLDTLKSLVGKAQVTVATIEDKGDELRLPIIISGTITDYTVFLKSIENLQSMKFPFFTIGSLVTTGATGVKGEIAFTYEIQGILKMPKTGFDTSIQGTKRNGN
ncbi:MAG: hypothetical protein NT178_00250 [Proteobacteria bacterium]|nr:hypothetical protein [Pseudomonadota bacterium]